MAYFNTDIWIKRAGLEKSNPDDARDPFDKDYGRIIHSSSFRRLQGKTQILNLGDSDFYRTRLTHSLEVAQIAGSVTKQLKHSYPDHEAIDYLPPANLVQTLGLIHDIGHPPFGHGGEVALNYCMRDHGGFEGNGQTLRVITKLAHYSKHNGMNLTRRTILGALKYPISYSEAVNSALLPSLNKDVTSLHILDRKSSTPPKCYLDSEAEQVGWLLEAVSKSDRDLFCSKDINSGKHHAARYKSLDCSIMDIADDIAYGVHDLEDAITLDLISKEQFTEKVPEGVCEAFLDYHRSRFKTDLPNNLYEDFVERLFGSSDDRKHMISRLVGYFMTALDYKIHEEFECPILKYNLHLKEQDNKLLKALKNVVFSYVIRDAAVQHLEFKGQKMVVSVFEALASEPECFLPSKTRRRYVERQNDLRVICDHIAGMTDGYLLKMYERLFSPRMGSIFDKL